MDIYMTQHNYRIKYLVVRDGGVYVYKYERCKFDQHFISFQPKRIFIGKSKACDLTEFSGVADNSSDFEVNSLLPEVEDRNYV